MKAAALIFPAALALAACSNVVQQGPSDTLRAYAQALEQGRVDDAYHLLSDEAKRSMSVEAFRRAVKENPHEAGEIAQALARPASDPVVTATVTVPSGDELLLIYEGGRWRIDASAVDLYGQATPRQAIMGFLRAFERKRYDVILRYVPDAEREGTAGAVDEPPSPPADASHPGGRPGAPSDKTPADAKQADAAAKPGDPTKPPADVKAGDAKKPAEGGALGSGGAALTPDKLREAWEGPYKDQISRIVQAIKTALPTAQIEETGDSAAMSYGAGGTVAFVREHGAWKIRDF